MTTEEKIRIECDEVGVDANMLTVEEIDLLKKEIEAKEQGYAILDGVLDNPELRWRKYKESQASNN